MSWFDDAMMVVNPVGWLGNNALTGGGASTAANAALGIPDPNKIRLSGSNAAARQADLEAGLAKGREIFENDPEMQRLKKIREEYAKGYSGQELGGMRQTARGEIAGAQAAQQRKLQSSLARGGVGGARAAAISAAQGREGQKAINQAETKMALDSAQMARQGAADLQDFIFRQKYGSLGTSLGYGQLGATDRSTAAQAAANTAPKQGLLGQLLGGIF